MSLGDRDPRTRSPSTRTSTRRLRLKTEEKASSSPKDQFGPDLVGIWPCKRLFGRLFSPGFASRRVLDMSLGDKDPRTRSLSTRTSTRRLRLKLKEKASSSPKECFYASETSIWTQFLTFDTKYPPNLSEIHLMPHRYMAKSWKKFFDEN